MYFSCRSVKGDPFVMLYSMIPDWIYPGILGTIILLLCSCTSSESILAKLSGGALIVMSCLYFYHKQANGKHYLFSRKSSRDVWYRHACFFAVGSVLLADCMIPALKRQDEAALLIAFSGICLLGSAAIFSVARFVCYRKGKTGDPSQSDIDGGGREV